jgi:glutamate synthase domain-containing protein 2
MLWVRPLFVAVAVVTQVVIAAAFVLGLEWMLWLQVIALPLTVLGARDMVQDQHAILRNFPLIGHFRYLFEEVRPEIQQYFIESNTDGKPFSREQRSVVYQRAKQQLDTVPFGTQLEVYAQGYEWIAHSLAPKHPEGEPPRVTIGGADCSQPYSSSLLNISAMSYGSLSREAITALNLGAKQGGFAHNTGEGGISPYHLQGGDLIWQVGTGYFGARAADGGFDPGAYAENARRPEVKMVELKLSQGAKPGHGGILPARKVTQEISEIRGVPMGQDVLSPPNHRAFDTPIGLLEFVAQLREGSGGKPVGVKLCVGQPWELAGLCKAMVETGITPDYLAIDGGEGGTGAAPVEFSNSMGMPLLDGLALTHSMLVGYGLRDKLKVVASGKVATGFDVAVRLAAGADLCAAARSMMFALGCIQALRCNNNECPAGIATQDPRLTRGLVIEQKAPRVARYHHETVLSFCELLGAAGMTDPSQLEPDHIHRRVSATQVRTYAEIYDYVEPWSLLKPPYPPGWARTLARAHADRW